MDITKRLQDLDPTLVLHNEGHWDLPHDPNMSDYSSFNDAGICTEDGEFLYAMVRILKPDHVLETGTHIGVGAAYMGQALKDNGKGKLQTIEFLPEIRERAFKRIMDLELTDWVSSFLMDVKDFVPEERGLVGEGAQQREFITPIHYKLILLDTEPQTRFAELIKFFPNLEPGGFVFIHDLHQHMHQIENEEHGFAWPFGRLPLEIEQLVLSDQLRPFHFETPRGLTGFYKPHPNDYDWHIREKNNPIHVMSPEELEKSLPKVKK